MFVRCVFLMCLFIVFSRCNGFLSSFKLFVWCVCSMWLFYVFVSCFFDVSVWCVCSTRFFLCDRSLCLSNVSVRLAVRCLCSMCWSDLFGLCACSMYLFYVVVPCLRSECLWTFFYNVPVRCVCSMWRLFIRCACSMCRLHVVVVLSLFCVSVLCASSM